MNQEVLVVPVPVPVPGSPPPNQRIVQKNSPPRLVRRPVVLAGFNHAENDGVVRNLNDVFYVNNNQVPQYAPVAVQVVNSNESEREDSGDESEREDSGDESEDSLDYELDENSNEPFAEPVALFDAVRISDPMEMSDDE
jgi:hypothetical protein